MLDTLTQDNTMTWLLWRTVSHGCRSYQQEMCVPSNNNNTCMHSFICNGVGSHAMIINIPVEIKWLQEGM